jgi:DNA polymerase-3 subunit gamma/tau
MAAGRPDAVADAASAPATFRLGTFREVVAFVAQRREPMLHSHLLHSVHLVRFAPPVIELRPQPVAPRTLSADLARLLTEATGTRWTIAVSLAQGEPTLAEQGAAADTARRSAAADHPMVRAILDAFPGARIETVHDRNADAYGLPVGAPIAGGDADGIAGFGDDPDIPPFAPPDAEYFDDDPMETDS